jgi:hypothetical protein
MKKDAVICVVLLVYIDFKVDISPKFISGELE